MLFQSRPQRAEWALVALWLALGSSACIYSPVDGSELSASARFDGSPPPFSVEGGVSDPATTIELEAWNWQNSVWEKVDETTPSGGFIDVAQTMYEWTDPKFKVRNLEQVRVDPATGNHQVRVRGRELSLGGTLVTFNADGFACLAGRISDGASAALAGQQCWTGNQLDLYYAGYDNAPVTTRNLDNLHGCTEGASLRALSTENNHRYAQRFTPPSYPFTVQQVRYNIVHDVTPEGLAIGCRADRAHSVEFFVGPHGEPPPAAPVEVFAFPVSEPTPASDETLVGVDVPVTFTVEDGEDLFVAVRMVHAAGDDVLCLSSCMEPSTHLATNHYWSNSDTTPYPWVTLASFGPTLMMNPQVFVTGVTP